MKPRKISSQGGKAQREVKSLEGITPQPRPLETNEKQSPRGVIALRKRKSPFRWEEKTGEDRGGSAF